MKNFKAQENNNWLSKNSIRKYGEDFVKILIKMLKLREEDINLNQNCYGEEDIIFESMGNKYKIQIEEEYFRYKLGGFNKSGNPRQLEKYHLITYFDGESDLIFDIIRFIKNINKKYEIESKDKELAQ